MALGRSFGKICRGGVVSVVASAAGDFVSGAEEPPFAAPVENRSGVVRSMGSPSMRVIMPLTMRGGNQHRAKKVPPDGIEGGSKDYRGVPWINSRIASATAFGGFPRRIMPDLR